MPKKFEKTEPPWELDSEDKKAIHSWCKQRYPKLVPRLTEMWDQCRDWYLNHPERWHFNWPAAFRRWIVRENTPYQAPKRGTDERPQEQRANAKRELATVAAILASAKKKDAS